MITTTNNDNNDKNVNNGKNIIQKPDGVSDQTWNDFKLHRKEKKAKLTQTALNKIISQAKKANWTLEEALQECCSRGWTGFNAEWVKRDGEVDLSNTYAQRMIRQHEEEMRNAKH